MSPPTAHILVDANIARAATDPARHPTSDACMRFARVLERRDCKTGVAITPALQEEWGRHASPTMKRWLARMESSRRLRREDKRVSDLRKAIELMEDAGTRAALTKDAHLSEAAIMHGIPVASLDDKQKNFLRRLSADYATIGRIQWMNPTTDGTSEWEPWLLSGSIDANVFCCR